LFKCDNKALDIATMNACIIIAIVVVMITEAAQVATTDLTILEQKCTSTALDATLTTKKVCLGLADPEKMVVIGDNLGEK
jgi:hypothetical protein